MKSNAIRRSAFDYAVTVSRRNRYLVVSSPDFGLHAGAQSLLLDHLNPSQLGEAILKMYERIRFELDRISMAGGRQPHPSPLSYQRAVPLTVTRAAQALGVTPFILRRLCDSGEIDFTRTPGGHRRISLEALSGYLLLREQSAA